MRKKGYKGRCEKKDLSKSQEVCRTYDAIQSCDLFAAEKVAHSAVSISSVN